MPVYRVKSTARIVRLLFIIAVFVLVAAIGTNYALGKGDFYGWPEQYLPLDGGVRPSETPFAGDPVAVAAPAPPSPEVDRQADPADSGPESPQPDPAPNLDFNPASTPAVPSPQPTAPPAAPLAPGSTLPSVPEPTSPPSPEPAPPSSPEPAPPPAPPPTAQPTPTPAPTFPAEGSAVVTDKPVNAASGAAAPAATVSSAPAPASSAFTLGPGCKRNLRMRIVVTNSGGDESCEIRMEIPLLGKLNSPYQAVLGETFSHTPTAIDTVDQGSRIGHFYIDALASGSSVTLIIDYTVRVHPFTAHFAAYAERPVSGSPGYLYPSSRIESDHPRIVAQAAEITSGKTGDLEKARAIYEFVQRYLHYDLASPYRNQGALSALETATGVCEEYAALFTALCRAAGIPARQVNGYTDPRGTGKIFDTSLALRGYRHSWAEFYLEGMGWLPADPAMNIGAASLPYFGSLSGAGYIAQNYQDQPMRVKFAGGRLAVTWEELLVQ